jgi:hypothetical protein
MHVILHISSFCHTHTALITLSRSRESRIQDREYLRREKYYRAGWLISNFLCTTRVTLDVDKNENDYYKCEDTTPLDTHWTSIEDGILL